MSQENVEITEAFETLRRGVEAWNREDLDAFLETWHPDCEWRPAFPRSLEGVGAVYRGREGIARAWEGVRGVWKVYRLDVEDAQAVGEKLVVVGRVYARGIESGLELDSGWSAVITVRDGLTIRAWDWLDRDEALKAVGLSESAMSQENVEVVRAFFEAWNRREEETQTEAFAPDIEFRTAGPSFFGLDAVYHGHAGLRKFTQEFREPWDEISIDTERIIERGEQVVVLVRLRGKGRDGIEVERPFAQIWTMRGGRAVRVEGYADQQKALEAVGLSE